MHRALVAASLIAVSAMVAYAAVPLGVYQRTSPPPTARNEGGSHTSQATIAAQQSTPGGAERTVDGQVLDGAGAPLAAAVVDAWHEASGWRNLALTDAGGRFLLQGVPAGKLTLTVRRGIIEFAQVIQIDANVKQITLRDSSSQGDLMALSALRGGSLLAREAGPAAAGRLPAHVGGHVTADALLSMSASAPLPPTSMDAYARVDPFGFRRVGEAPLSTFSVDVDTASYSNARRFLVEGELPPADAVRLEEWINYFQYTYPAPQGRDAFRVDTMLTACPWNAEHQLLRVGVRGRDDAALRL